ncbi:hypothetical protein CJJ44_10420 [Listeria monocytogenes]|nr:hypothetical protein [Listeria monocytogenes]MBC1385445.1 DUF3139 domain-containing protein [Listeria innocua]EAC7083834.1 hypothetical protein [Listeria monocytogenes]EAD0622401.1 hypothetical protein [Listeria monocytogenes]EAD8590387.1 hypothetical protein [Listeria monocytogenes]
MKKYKKWWITLGVLLVLCFIGYLFLSVIPRHKANEAVDDYLAAQNQSLHCCRWEVIIFKRPILVM